MAQVPEWLKLAIGAAERLADGEVSDEDVEYIVGLLDHLEDIQGRVKDFLQSLVDEPEEQERARQVLAILMLIQMGYLMDLL